MPTACPFHHQRVLAPLTASAVAALLLSAGCGGNTPATSEVVPYVALDREFSKPILDEFAATHSIQVLAKYDVESTKTVGLASAILAEKARPRCDLFWNNEILHTLRLENAGLLEPFDFPGSDQWPADYRSPHGTWYGLAARARVILVNTTKVNREDRPKSIRDLADPRWKDQVGLAKPLFGTTATHAAVLFSTWGDEETKKFFHSVRGNAQILSGNKQVAISVGSGQLAWGLTDTDDAIIELEQGQPVAIVFPDQEEGGLGTLFIPNTVALIKGGPHPEAAKKLARTIFDPAAGVEMKLAKGPSAQFPLNPAIEEQPRVAPEPPPRWMQVDFAAAAEKWDSAAKFLQDEFGQ